MRLYVVFASKCLSFHSRGTLRTIPLLWRLRQIHVLKTEKGKGYTTFLEGMMNHVPDYFKILTNNASLASDFAVDSRYTPVHLTVGGSLMQHVISEYYVTKLLLLLSVSTSVIIPLD